MASGWQYINYLHFVFAAKTELHFELLQSLAKIQSTALSCFGSHTQEAKAYAKYLHSHVLCVLLRFVVTCVEITYRLAKTACMH